jgi:hypothetical protein
VCSAAGIDHIDPQQDKILWNKPALLKLQLSLDADGKPSFKPQFHQIERMVQSVLDGAIRTTFDIPRLGSQMMVAPSISNANNRTSANSIPTMDLEDEELIVVRSG